MCAPRSRATPPRRPPRRRSCPRPTRRRRPTRPTARTPRTIRTQLGANAVRAAYFQGHIEFLGLAARRRARRAGGAADLCPCRAASRTLGQLATASGLTEADIRAANPKETFTGALPPRLGLPGARDHRIVGVTDAGAAVIETRAQIAEPERRLGGRPRARQPGRRRLDAARRRRPRPGAQALMTALDVLAAGDLGAFHGLGPDDDRAAAEAAFGPSEPGPDGVGPLMGDLSPFRRYPPAGRAHGVVVWFAGDRVQLVDVPSPALDANDLLRARRPGTEGAVGPGVFHVQLAWPSRGLAAHVSEADGAVRALYAFAPDGRRGLPGVARRRAGPATRAMTARLVDRRAAGVPRLRAGRPRAVAGRVRGRAGGARRRAVGAAGARRHRGRDVPGTGDGGQGR